MAATGLPHSVGGDYGLARSITRQHAGPAAAMRLDRLGAQVGRAEAVRYVAETNGMLEP